MSTDKRVAEWVNGKRIIIVGRSMHLLTGEPQGDYKTWEKAVRGVDFLTGEPHGDLIDSYDIVVRVNHPLPFAANPYNPYVEMTQWDTFIPREYQSHLGSRCDILFAYLKSCSSIFANRDRVQSFIDAGGKAIIHTEFDRERFLPADYAHVYESDVSVFDMILPGDLQTHLQGVVGNPFTGTYAIAYFLSYDVAEIQLIGFTCHQTTDERHEFEIIKDINDKSAHKGDLDLQWIYHTAQTDKRLKVDSYLTSTWEQQCKEPKQGTSV